MLLIVKSPNSLRRNNVHVPRLLPPCPRQLRQPLSPLFSLTGLALPTLIHIRDILRNLARHRRIALRSLQLIPQTTLPPLLQTQPQSSPSRQTKLVSPSSSSLRCTPISLFPLSSSLPVCALTVVRPGPSLILIAALVGATSSDIWRKAREIALTTFESPKSAEVVNFSVGPTEAFD